MVYDLTMLEAFYSAYKGKVEHVRAVLKRPLTLAEKILYAHLFNEGDLKNYKRGEDYVNFRPDRVAMQDATAQMALLQFMNAGKEKVAVPSTVHCDHLIQAYKGAKEDIATATKTNEEVYDFLRDVSSRYGIGFWKPGAGIIHQVVLENYAFPGGMMVGTDSHTPNAGGLGMVAIGVGGADAVDVMTGMEWELKMPRIIGVRLTGKLSGWTSPKDVILKLAGILTVKGGTNSIIEYFGPGTASLSATGKATICNMGAEVGATTSLFPFDGRMATYLRATGRDRIVELAEAVDCELRADQQVTDEPEKYYDRVIDIDLSTLEPYINGPFTPDAATPISEFAEKVLLNGYPRKMEVGLIGSCTNSSYQDLSRAASLARQVKEKNLSVASPLIINPGSEQIRATAERDGMMDDFMQIGAVIMANACGPCIGQWKRHTDDPTRKNSIVTSFNRNFAKRADGNPNTYAFVASPELTMALTIAGDLCFNPLKDRLMNHDGEKVNRPNNAQEIYLKELGSESPMLVRLIMKSIYKQNKREVKHIGCKRFGIQYLLKGIYTHNGLLYFHTEIRNQSNVPFDVDYITWKIVDKKVAKRTAVQEQIILPLRAQNYATCVPGRKSERTVFTMAKFTIPDGKCLVVELNEKNGGRHQSFVIENEDLVRANTINELQVR